MRRFIYRHIYGILGTIIVHIAIALLFMLIRLNTTIRERQDAFLVDFEIDRDIPEFPEPEVGDRYEELLQDETYWANIAANLAASRAEEFDIEEYIDQIKRELIESGEISEENYLDEMRSRMEQSLLPGETGYREQEDQEEEKTAEEMAASYTGATRIYYNLPGRIHRRLPLPIYKCIGDGKVTMEIEVNQYGLVTSAAVLEDESTADDYCLHDMAKDAALRSRFNMDLSAPQRQTGTITYLFVAQ